jgi:hypothetical protein
MALPATPHASFPPVLCAYHIIFYALILLSIKWADNCTYLIGFSGGLNESGYADNLG